MNLDLKIEVVEKMTSFTNPTNSSEMSKNLKMIEVRDMIESAVSATVKRTIELQTHLGDIIEQQQKHDQKLRDFMGLICLG